MRAVQMLLKASNQGLIDPRSVSMIILMSDGDPTVGKAPPIFLPNRRRKARQEVAAVCWQARSSSAPSRRT